MHLLLKRTAFLCSVALLAPSVFAQSARVYPDKPVRLVVPFPAGGPSDVLARVVALKMQERLHQTIFIDNKPGANTIIGADAVAKSAPDGYTLLMALDNTLTMNQYLYSKLPYDPFKDFDPIGKMAVSPLIMITNTQGPKTIDVLLAQIKADPTKVSYGFGTFTTQLSGEMLKRVLGKGMVSVPYQGSAGTTQGLLSNDVTFTLDGITAAMPHIQAGKFQAVAKLSSKAPAAFDKVPTLTEAGVKFPEMDVWIGLVAPRGTPPAIINQLNREMMEALRSQDVKDKLLNVGLVADGSSPEAMREFMVTEAARWKPIIEEAGIKMD